MNLRKNLIKIIIKIKQYKNIMLKRIKWVLMEFYKKKDLMETFLKIKKQNPMIRKIKK